MRAVSIKIKASPPSERPSRRRWAFIVKGPAGIGTRLHSGALTCGTAATERRGWCLGSRASHFSSGIWGLSSPPGWRGGWGSYCCPLTVSTANDDLKDSLLISSNSSDDILFSITAAVAKFSLILFFFLLLHLIF